MADVLVLEQIRKSFGLGTEVETEILHGIDLTARSGEFLALMGPSGSGKSTLLNIIGLLDRPTSGRLVIAGHDVAALDDAALTALRGRTIGFVFQYHYLITAFTALENVMMPMLVDRGRPSEAAEARAAALLEWVGLSQWSRRRVANLSGGQQQRVAIARALAMDPALVLADEPTGNLDTRSADNAFELMRRIGSERGTTFVMVTHNLDLARRCDRIVEIIDGRIAPTPGAGLSTSGRRPPPLSSPGILRV